MQDFGVIICTCRFDFFLAKACVASVRRAMGDVPITLFMDDDVKAGPLAREFNLNLMYRSQLEDPFLRRQRGWGMPKVSLFWVSPYERFLYLDCDTIVWGDVSATYLQGDWDMVIDPGDLASRPWVAGVGTEQWVNKDYWNTALLEQHHPDFPWRRYAAACFCTGCYAARRGIFSLDQYKAILNEKSHIKGLYLSAEMGLLNFMIFNAMERGLLNVQQRPIQLMCDYNNMKSLPQRLVIGSDGPVVQPGDVKILHFTDPKPLTVSYGFHAPFDYFRKQVARKLSLVGKLAPGLYIRFEEIEWRFTQWWRHSRLAKFHRYVRPLLFWKRSRA